MTRSSSKVCQEMLVLCLINTLNNRCILLCSSHADRTPQEAQKSTRPRAYVGKRRSAPNSKSPMMALAAGRTRRQRTQPSLRSGGSGQTAKKSSEPGMLLKTGNFEMKAKQPQIHCQQARAGIGESRIRGKICSAEPTENKAIGYMWLWPKVIPKLQKFEGSNPRLPNYWNQRYMSFSRLQLAKSRTARITLIAESCLASECPPV